MKYIKVLFIVFPIVATGQNKIIKCFLYDKISNKPIENAYILSVDKPKTISNEDGSFEIIKGENIIISHISYEKMVVESIKMNDNEKLFLTPRNYTLTEVKVYPNKNVENIIKECIIKKKQNYRENFEQIFKINHLVKNFTDTLVLLDGPLKLKWNLLDDRYFIDKSTKIIRKYFEIIDKNEYNFNVEAKRILYSFDIENLPFFIDVSNYNYYLDQENDDYYDLSFSPKKEGKFNYEGVLKINKKDFAVLIVDAKLVKNKKNSRITVINNFVPSDKYLFLEEKMQYVFEKNTDSFYHFKSAFHTIKMQQFKIGKIINPKNLAVQTIILDAPNTILKNEFEINLRYLTKAIYKDGKRQKETLYQKNLKEKITKELDQYEENN